jgi:phage gp45-like
MNILNRIRNLFKFAKLMSVNDAGGFQYFSVSMLGKTQTVLGFTPYGLMSCPPAGSMVALWSQQGHEANGVGMADDPNNRILKDMVDGEVALGNYVTLAYLLFDKDSGYQLVVPLNVTETIGGDSVKTVTGNDTETITGSMIKAITANSTKTVTGVDTETITGNKVLTAAAIQLNGYADNLTMWSALNTKLQLFMTAYNAHTHGGAAPLVSHTLDISTAKANTLYTSG